jgi:hypothetical protein
MPRISRAAVAAGAAAATALAAAGGVALVVGAPGASGSAPRPSTAVTVYKGDGTRAPAVDPVTAKAFETQLSEVLPGYKLVADDSFDYTDKGGADYTRLTGTASGRGVISVSVYRYFDASELRAADLTETTEASVGTFWVGALDQDMTAVYFQPVNGSPIWLGQYASTTSGPAPALADVKALAVRVAGLPAVRAMAEGKG